MEFKERCERTDTVHQLSAPELDRRLYESEAVMAASLLFLFPSLLTVHTSDRRGERTGLDWTV